jgi:hypothetical protein
MKLTTSPNSRAECHEIWEPKPPVTVWATPGLLQVSFTFTSYSVIGKMKSQRNSHVECLEVVAAV